MGLIATTIEAVVNTLTTTTTYLRASKLEEANKNIAQTDIVTNPIALYYDTDQITTEVNSSGVVEVHAVRIAFLKRSTPDNTGIAEDALRDSMKTSAVEFYTSLVSNFSTVFEQFQGYELDPASTGEKVFNEVMTGYTLSLDIRVLGACSIVSVVGTLVNSEGTTINTLTPAETKTQPDITVTQTDDTTAPHPSDKNLDVDNFQGAGITTFAGLIAATSRGYNFPLHTGQVTSYRTGDDANIESTIFGVVIRGAEAIKARNALDSFFVLSEDNSLGNTDRFTDTAGGQDYDGVGNLINYIIDHYTGLGWNRVSIGSLIFNDSIDNALSSTLNSFSDWFLPNLNQFQSIVSLGVTSNFLNYSPFNGSSGTYGTSTTNHFNTSNRQYFSINQSFYSAIAKSTLTGFNLICRKHF